MKLFRTDTPLAASWDLVKPSWTLVQRNFWPVVYLSLLPSLVLMIGLVLVIHGTDPATGAVSHDTKTTSGSVLVLLGGLWALLAYPGAITLQTDAIKGKTPDTLDCFRRGLKRFFPLIGLELISTILILLGFVALIIPGLLLVRGLYLSQFYVIDRKLSIVEAMKRSYEDSRPHSGYIWGVIGVTAVFGLLGSVLGRIPVIGNILSLGASLPYYFGTALRYKEITKNTQASAR